jgi:hypothetical protein
MHDLSEFDLSDVVECSATLRRRTENASSMEEAANAVVHFLYDALRDPAGGRALALVRFFKTHVFEMLEPQQQMFARGIVKDEERPERMKCLTLLATRGDEPAWNSRELSRGHAAIPLPSEKMVENAPMIAQLITQLGLDIGVILRPDPETIVDIAQRTYNVFFVPEAKGSPFIPAQTEFVVPYGIRSVLGFGGILPTGNLFAVIMFSKAAIRRETADMFANVALAVKLAVLPFDGRVTFAGSSPS